MAKSLTEYYRTLLDHIHRAESESPNRSKYCSDILKLFKNFCELGKGLEKIELTIGFRMFSQPAIQEHARKLQDASLKAYKMFCEGTKYGENKKVSIDCPTLAKLIGQYIQLMQALLNGEYHYKRGIISKRLDEKQKKDVRHSLETLTEALTTYKQNPIDITKDTFKTQEAKPQPKSTTTEANKFKKKPLADNVTAQQELSLEPLNLKSIKEASELLRDNKFSQQELSQQIDTAKKLAANAEAEFNQHIKACEIKIEYLQKNLSRRESEITEEKSITRELEKISSSLNTKQQQLQQLQADAKKQAANNLKDSNSISQQLNDYDFILTASAEDFKSNTKDIEQRLKRLGYTLNGFSFQKRHHRLWKLKDKNLSRLQKQKNATHGKLQQREKLDKRQQKITALKTKVKELQQTQQDLKIKLEKISQEKIKNAEKANDIKSQIFAYNEVKLTLQQQCKECRWFYTTLNTKVITNKANLIKTLQDFLNPAKKLNFWERFIYKLCSFTSKNYHRAREHAQNMLEELKGIEKKHDATASVLTSTVTFSEYKSSSMFGSAHNRLLKEAHQKLKQQLKINGDDISKSP